MVQKASQIFTKTVCAFDVATARTMLGLWECNENSPRDDKEDDYIVIAAKIAPAVSSRGA